MKFFFAYLWMVFLHSCSLATKEDRHPEVSTLEELIAANKVIQVEARDSTVMHTIEMLSDSLYYSKRQLHISQLSGNQGDQKIQTGYVVKHEIRLKNMYTGTTYVLDTVRSDSALLMDENKNIIRNGFLYAAPGYSTKKTVDSATLRNGFVPIKQHVVALKNQLPEFDESIVYRWTNGRLPNFHTMYYYELDGQRFKSLGTACYRVNNDPMYFYQARFGILKLK